MKRSVQIRLRAARGIVLIDALIAILIFSIGIIGMVALQASATKLSGDAKYRTSAATLADQVIAQMWISGAQGTTKAQISANLANYVTNGTLYTPWKALVYAALPGAGITPPTITVDANNLVTITIHWKAPEDSSVHNYVSITSIN